MSASDASFVIHHTLLADNMAHPAWTNLGCWQRRDGSKLTSYVMAAEELASRVGAGALTTPHRLVVDLGCGHGASLQLWQQAFAAASVIGVERQAACVDSWQSSSQAKHSLYQGRFDQLPLPDAIAQAIPNTGCDAVVCVDAAYHAESLGAFAAVAQRLLRTQGQLAFTTVLLPKQSGLLQYIQTQMVAKLTGIPAASLVTASQLQSTLSRLGFGDIQIEYLDQEVLHGFAEFVQQRSTQLSMADKRSIAWLKIAATAAISRHWFNSSSMHYVLVSAKRTD